MSAPISPPHILIVEDDAVVALELEARMQGQGYVIAGIASSVAGALAQVEKSRVDLALVDVHLADNGDGIELAASLAERDIPTVVLTAHGDDRTLERVKRVGAQGYLLKPFDERLLRLTIETAVHRHVNERARRAAERDRQAAERAQHRAEVFQAAILDRSPDPTLVMAEDGTIELANRAAKRVFGLGARSELTPRLSELLPELDEAELWAASEGPQRTLAKRHRGPTFPAEVTTGVVALDDGERLIVIVRDITLSKQLEQRLARSQQLELAGRLSTSVTHDLANLFSAVAINGYLLDGAGPEELAELCRDINSSVEIGSRLTRRLRSVACGPTGDRRTIAVNEIIVGILGLLRRAVSSGVHFRLELDPRAGTVSIDPTQFDQIILNLAINADLAMPNGGKLTMRTLLVEPDDEPARVRVEVEDTGVGMSKQLQRKIFEPFFTTRKEHGSGLGLWIVKDIVERAGGILEFESRVGHGTCFGFELHRQGDTPSTPASEVAAKRDSRLALGKGRTVLLVDDDAVYLRSLTRLFEGWGFHVLAAAGPGEALLIAERGPDDLALALVDIEMPYMTGLELADRLAIIRAELPIMLLSGSACEFQGLGRAEILPKPLSPERIAAEVERLLEGQGGEP